jgi:transposase
MQERDFLVRAKDQLKLEVIAKVEGKQMTRTEAAIILKASESTIKRYVRSFREKGVGFLRHGNCLRKPVNKIPETIKQDVQRLVKEKYFDFNMLHAIEKIEEELGIKIRRETFRSWCHEIHHVKREKKRRSRPKYRRERMSQPGLLIQMDGSHHKWFGDRETCLIAAIDDATSEVIHAGFYEGETTLACLQVLKEIVKKKGVFQLLYTDKAGVFGGVKRTNFSQVERSLSDLGAQVIYAHSPEAKGRVERLFGTLQDRLIPEMRLSKIRTIEQANEFLQTQYLPQCHNPRYMVQAHNPVSAYRPLAPHTNLEAIFCVKEYRIIGKDHTVSVAGDKYLISDQLKFSIHKQRIELRFDQDGGWKAYFAGRELKLVKVQKLPASGARAA